MLEFIQKEVWVVEKEEINRSWLFSFFLPDNRDVLLIVNNQGKYSELITYDGLLQRKNMSSYVVCGSDMFAKAHQFYDDLENREMLLPILNAEFEIISFFRWNAQIERATFRMQDCVNVKNIFISGCDEVNIRILKELNDAQECKEKEIFLSGEGWEIMVSLLGLSGNCHIVERLPEKQDAVLIKSGGDIDLQTAESYVTTYTLKEKIKSKKIFVYGANLNGQMILSNLEFMEVHVHGIIDDKCNKEKKFLIWPIVKSKDIIGKPDVIVVCEKWRWTEINQRLQSACQVYAYEDIFQWDESLNEKKYVLLYDSVHALEKVKRNIESCSGEIEDEISVHKLTEKMIDTEANMVFPLQFSSWFKTDRYCYVLSKKLKRKIYRTMPYLHRDITALQVTNPFVRIHNAIRQGRKFILYGTNETYSAIWQKLFRYLELDFESVFDDEPERGKDIKNVYDLMYESDENILLVLGFDTYKWSRVCENLKSMGFSGKSVLGMHQFEELVLDATVDIQLGHIMLYEGEELEQYLGYQMYGAEGKDKYKIVTLGGSTTADAVYRVKSWPNCLYDKMKSDRDVVIYNAAVDGYSSSQELLKLLRDVCALRPNLVISFSGFNDLMTRENGNPFLPLYLGIVWESLPVRHWGGSLKQLPVEEELKGFDFWYKMEEIMNSISSILGFKFICFAQPMLPSQENLSQEKRWIFEREDDRKSAVEFRKKAGKIKQEWFVDMTDILDDSPEVFFDLIHVNEEGNRIIAEHIYHHIKRYL